MYNQCRTSGFNPYFKNQSMGMPPHFKPFFNNRRPKYNVPLNIIENENEYIIHVYATGFAKQDIEISVSNDNLIIKGNKTINEDPKFSQQEFPIKNFERAVALNNQIDIENITAKSENEILIITLQKTKEAKTKEKKVEIF